MPNQLSPNLVQGVSQQAPEERREGQCEAQFDCINSPVFGCAARPHAEFIAVLSGVSDFTGAFFSEIRRGSENYLVGAVGGQPFAYDLADGTECTITDVASATADDYLVPASGTAARKLRALTIEDTTFLLSRDVLPAMSATLSASRDPEALVFLRQADYKQSYSIDVTAGPGGSGYAAVVAVQTLDSDNVDAEEYTKPDKIVQALAFGAVSPSPYAGSGGLDGLEGYEASDVEGASMRIWRTDGLDFTIRVADEVGGQFLKCFKGTVQHFSDLPEVAFGDIVLKVVGESTTGDDDYYVQYVSQGGSLGHWEEVVAPATPYLLDANTMPHLLVLTGYRTFDYKVATWSSRIAGDEDTAKDPSFVGKNLRDIFWDHGRMAMATANTCVWSKSEFPYTFFPDTVQTLLATAPVDIKVLAGQGQRGGSTDIDFAVQIDEATFLWAQGIQYRVGSFSSDTFKQATAEAKPATAYQYASAADPLSIGKTLFFATDADYASLRALQFSDGRPVGDTDVTAHVPAYAEAGVVGLTATDTQRHLFVLSEGFTEGLYMYSFLYSDQEWLQSAWNTWRIPGGPILWASIKDNYLRLLQQRVEGAVLLKVNLSLVAKDPGGDYLTRLDFRVDETGVSGLSFDAGAGTTSFTLPYTPAGTPDILVVSRTDKAGGYARGKSFTVLDVTDDAVTVQGDLTGYEFYVGQRIDARRTETRFYVRTQQGPAVVEDLTVNSYAVTYHNTAYTRIEVSAPHLDDPKVAVFEGRALGNSTAITETPVPSTNLLYTGVGLRSEDATVTVINDSFMPSFWQAARWSYTATAEGRPYAGR